MSENKKPWVCEVLGVEVDEEWAYILPSLWARKDRFRLHTTRDGLMLEFYGKGEFGEDWMDATEVLTSNDIFYILKHPDGVIHKSHWTEDDIADAKAVRQLWPEAWSVRRDQEYMAIFNSASADIVYLDKKIFPSIQPGESVDLDVILEAENG